MEPLWPSKISHPILFPKPILLACFFVIKDHLVHAGATYQDAEVVVDGNLITSRQPADLPALLNAIIAALGGEVRCSTCQMVLESGQPRD